MRRPVPCAPSPVADRRVLASVTAHRPNLRSGGRRSRRPWRRPQRPAGSAPDVLPAHLRRQQHHPRTLGSGGFAIFEAHLWLGVHIWGSFSGGKPVRCAGSTSGTAGSGTRGRPEAREEDPDSVDNPWTTARCCGRTGPQSGTGPRTSGPRIGPRGRARWNRPTCPRSHPRRIPGSSTDVHRPRGVANTVIVRGHAARSPLSTA